jgi:hypothetical protein
VVALVPVVLGAPAMLVFIPPAMLLAPAMLARFVQLAPLMIRLPAVASMSLDGLVEFMVGVRDPALTPVDVFGVKSRRCSEEKHCAQDRAEKDGRCCV